MQRQVGPRRSDLLNSLAGWSFSENEIQEATAGSRMLNPSLDLSNPCNLNCPYCFIEEKNSPRKARFPDELSIQETFAVIDDFADSGAGTVSLVGAGEPTIDPYFEEIVLHIARHQMTPVIFTNGIRLARDKSLIQILYESSASVVLKFNSLSSRIQDLVAGRDGYVALRNRALEALLDWGFNKTYPTRLAFDIITFRGNFSELPQIHRLARRQNIHPVLADYIPTGRTSGGTFQGLASIGNRSLKERLEIQMILEPLTAQQRHALFEKLEQIDKDEFGISRDGGAAYFSGSSCTQALGVYVDVHGNIWPCVARSKAINRKLVPGKLGNIRAGDLPSRIWEKDRYLAALRSAYDGACLYKPLISLTSRLPIIGGIL